MTDTFMNGTGTDPAQEFLDQNSGDYASVFKFDTIGAGIGGTITRVDVVDGVDLEGKARKSMIVEVLTDSDQKWAIWIDSTKPRLVSAVRDACREAGVASPLVGDKLAVTFKSEVPSKKAGFNPSKVYAASYKRSAAAPAPAPAEAPVAAGATSPSDLI